MAVRLLEARSHQAAVAIAAVLMLAVPAATFGQKAAPTPEGETDLAMRLSNPVSDLVSVPFQFNWDQGVGPDDHTRFVLNVQPVMPFSVSDDWNLITRLIVPMVSQPALFPGGSPTFGVSDVLATFFVSPSKQLGLGKFVSKPEIGPSWRLRLSVVLLLPRRPNA